MPDLPQLASDSAPAPRDDPVAPEVLMDQGLVVSRVFLPAFAGPVFHCTILSFERHVALPQPGIANRHAQAKVHVSQSRGVTNPAWTKC